MPRDVTALHVAAVLPNLAGQAGLLFHIIKIAKKLKESAGRREDMQLSGAA